jgi:hypothetical protein
MSTDYTSAIQNFERGIAAKQNPAPTPGKRYVMIARFSRFVAASLIASTLAFGATSFAQILPQQLDPASIYGWITIDSTGNVVNAFDSSNNSVLISVPAASLFAGRTPSVTANGSLMDQDITLTALNAEGLSFTLKNVKLIRSNDEGDTLQLEVTITSNGAISDTQGVQLRLENTTVGTHMTFGVQVNSQ